MNHINQYHKLFKDGIATEPMPHLYIISDEFAELKSEQPDFMKELVSTARIGRSLGIHLILATQNHQVSLMTKFGRTLNLNWR